MDAREQLRRYLEQRREAGETELVFDSLPVDEAMRILGAASTEPGTMDDPRAQSPQRSRVRDGDPATSADWRSVLKEAGAHPAPGSPTPAANAPAPTTLSATAPLTPAAAVPKSTEPARLPAAAVPEPIEPAVPPSAAVPRTIEPATEPSESIPLDQYPAGIVIGGPGKELFGSGPRFSTLNEIAEAVATCTACSLYRDARNPVPGEGNPNAQLVCVGEAPGATEDELGRPFVGQAGQLLDKILLAIGLQRTDVYICNVLKHRPPGNRNPMPDEVQACSPFLVRQIELIQPRVIVALGTFAAQTLLATREGIGKLRGRIHRYHGVPLIVTYHPAALLRNPAWKRPTWDDVKLAKRLLDRAGS